MAVCVLQLNIVAGVGFMDGEYLQHLAVVFPQKARHTRGLPVGWRGADCINAGCGCIERWSRFQKGDTVATLKFGHLDNFTTIRIRKPQDLMFLDKVFQGGNRGSCIIRQLVAPAAEKADFLK